MKKKLPVSESEFLQILENISKKLAYKFKFGYHDIEDMKQQISIFALEGLKNYDNKRPLENFLWTHVRNRLFNYKRDNYQRPDKPCLTCPFYQKQLCTKYSNKNDCELYSNWYSKNHIKKNLMYLTTIDEIKDFSNIFNDLEPNHSIANQEIIDFVEDHLNGEYRTIYLKLKNGNKINKADTTKLTNKIKELIDIYGEKKRTA
jgi:hypothetical protein